MRWLSRCFEKRRNKHITLFPCQITNGEEAIKNTVLPATIAISTRFDNVRFATIPPRHRVSGEAKLVLLGALTLFLLTACGGGGGSTKPAPPILLSSPRSAPTATVLNTPDDAGFAARQRSFENSEYNAPYPSGFGTDTHLARINAAAAYARGATGTGQKLMVVDTGIRDTHNEFIGKTVTKTTDSGYMPTDAEKFHGTAVSALAVGRRDGRGMHGVAFDATLHVKEIRLGTSDGIYRPAALSNLNDEFYAGPQWFGGFIADAVANDASVLNFSFGVSGVISSYDRTAVRRQLSRSAATLAQAGVAPADKTIIVMSAGNNGSQRLPNGSPARKDSPNVFAGMGAYFPELQSHVLAVVALDQDGTIASYSNHCGIAKAFCFAAPGSDLVAASSIDDSGYRSAGGGTSFAAPLVSGSLALLRQYFRRQLGNHELVDRLLATANRESIYANSNIYGHGLVDLDAATAPVGVMMTGLPGDPNSRVFAGSGISLSGGAFGASLPEALADMEIAGFDALGAPFFQSAASWVRPTQEISVERGVRKLSLSFDKQDVQNYAQFRQIDSTMSDHINLSLTVDSSGAISDARLAFADGWWFSYGQHGGALPAWYNGSFDPRLSPPLSASSVSSSTGQTVQESGRLGRSTAAYVDNSLAFIAPYLSLVRDGPTVGWSRSLVSGASGSHKRFGFALMHGAPQFDNQQKAGGERGFGVLLSITTDSARLRGNGLSLQAGAVREGDGFLGVRPKGVFGKANAATTFAGINGAWTLAGNDNWRLLTSAYLGRTRPQIDDLDVALLHEASTIVSSAFSMAATRASIWRHDDWLSLRLSQPLRAERGHAKLRVPVGRTKYREVVYKNHTVNLAPSGRALDVEAIYHLPIAGGTLETRIGMERHRQHHSANPTRPFLRVAFERRF